MGRRPVGIQPTDSPWPGISAGLLGPHRIRLRPRLDSAEALDWDSRSHHGTVGDFSRYVGIGVHSHPYQGMDEGPWGGSQILAPSRSSPRQLKGFGATSRENLNPRAAETRLPRVRPTGRRPPDL